MIIGLTGGIGSGKTAVSDYLQTQGYPIVDTDVIAREVVEPNSAGLKAIEQHFGQQIIQEDGSLDRAALREIVFQNPKERAWLENLTHPLIRARMIEQLKIAETQATFAVLSSPLLLETDQHLLVDSIIVVDLPEPLQLERASKRDRNNVEQIKRIMNSQISREERLKKADFIIDNSGSLESLYPQVDQICELIRAQQET